MANTPNGHDCLSFEQEIIQSLLELEHARVQAKKEVELAAIRADFDADADARATDARLTEENARTRREHLSALLDLAVNLLAPIFKPEAPPAARRPAIELGPSSIDLTREDDE